MFHYFTFHKINRADLCILLSVCYIFFGNFYLHIKSSGILHVLVSSWDETKSIAVFCKPAGQDEATSSTTYKCLSSSSCKFSFSLQVFFKLGGIKYFYIQPCGTCLCKFKQTLTVDLLMMIIVLRNYQLV